MPDPRPRGRPPADPEFGPQPGAMRQRWYRKRQDRLQRRMARLQPVLWEHQPAEWRDEREYQHRDVLDLAHRLAATLED